ncbi:hypothetical protein KA183_14605 [bacterium]|nr:hypothetical protein [bacterium]
MRSIVFVRILTAFIVTIFLCGPALADSTSRTQGLNLYNQGKYSQALPFLQKFVRESPYDSSGQYYLALCYQAMKQNGLARQHFQWVAGNSKDQKLKSYAANALNSLSAPQGSGTNAPVKSQGTSNSGSSSRQLGRCKVIMFETSWCHYCHEFAPEFDAAANKYRGVMDFQRLDAEENTDLKAKYNVRSYPRLVYLDGKGNILYNEGRGAFSERLTELSGK